MLVGLPGTGKSRLARRLGAELEAQVVESDRVRKQLFAEPRYTGGEHAAVYGWCHTVLRSALVVGRRVIFDATNLEERVRWKVYDIAAKRRQERRADDEDLSDADWLVYLDMRRRAEPIRRPHIVVNTATDYETLLRHLMQRLEDEAFG